MAIPGLPGRVLGRQRAAGEAPDAAALLARWKRMRWPWRLKAAAMLSAEPVKSAAAAERAVKAALSRDPAAVAAAIDAAQEE